MMIQEISFVLNTSAGVTFVVIGGALLAIRPARPGIPAFAAFALLSGAQQILGNLGSSALGGRALLASSLPFLAVAPIAVVFAASVYTGRDPVRWVTPFVALAGAGAALLLIGPALMVDENAFLLGAGLFLWSMPIFPALAIACVHFAKGHAEARSDELRVETLLLLCALLPYLAYTSAVGVALLALPGGIYGPVVDAGYLATFVGSLGASAWVGASLARSPHRGARWLVAGTATVAILGAAQALAIRELVLFGGLLRMIAALLLGYGLLKFGLFDVDLKLKWTLDRGTLLGIFGGVFFLVEQLAEFFVSALFGTIAGFAAAAILLLAFKPMREWSAQLADRVFPGVHADDAYRDGRRHVVYRTAAEAAARDGVITQRERAMLDALMRELGLARAEVDAIERQVIRGPASA